MSVADNTPHITAVDVSESGFGEHQDLLEGTTPGPWRTAGGDAILAGSGETFTCVGSITNPEDAELVASSPTLAAENARQREVIGRLAEALEVSSDYLSDWHNHLQPDLQEPPSQAELRRIITANHEALTLAKDLGR